jgi:hypothetical protein
MTLLSRTAWGGTILEARDFDVEGDGRRDVTRPLQHALDACAENGGVVRLEPGAYRVEGHIDVPANVTLEGIFNGPPAAGESGRDARHAKGTILLAYEGRGREDGPPFITLHANATLRGITVFYPEQEGAPAPYPPCVASGGGEGPGVVDCALLNPYCAVDFATNPSNRHYVHRLYGAPRRRGIAVDRCTDPGRIEHVRFGPFHDDAARQAAVRGFILENGEAFVFARSDGQQVNRTFCWGYRIGYRFLNSARGVCNGSFLGIEAEACNACVRVENCAPYAIQITNGMFIADAGPDPTSVVVGPANTGTVQFNNCSFRGHAHQNALIQGRGFVSFNQCHFIEWDRYGRGVPCIEARSGMLAVNGCRFASPGRAIHADAAVKGLTATGNLFAGEGAVETAEDVPAAVLGNVVARPPYDEPPGSRVIGVLGHHVSVAGEWTNISGRGSYTDFSYTARPGEGEQTFRWDLQTVHGGTHSLAAWVPDDPSPRHASKQHYVVHHTGGETEVVVDQRTAKGSWAPLGRFRLDENSHVLLDNRADGYVVADALLLTRDP